VSSTWSGRSQRRRRPWPYPADRDSDGVKQCADRLLGLLRLPVPLIVQLDDGSEVSCGDDSESESLRLATTRFEALRFRMGRRSQRQLAGLGWSGDPTPFLDQLVVFGPSPHDIFE
jgi:hypothetical protein